MSRVTVESLSHRQWRRKKGQGEKRKKGKGIGRGEKEKNEACGEWKTITNCLVP